MKFQLEAHIDNWVKEKFTQMGLINGKDFYEQSAMPDFLKEALKGGAKTKNKANFGKPEFSFDKFNNGKIAVIIENKLGLKKLIAETKDGIKLDEKSIQNFAVNGAINYANCMIDNGNFYEVIAVGISGDDTNNVQIKVYYVYGSGERSYKYLENVTTLDFLENENTFAEFYKNAVLTEEEKHKILIDSKEILNAYSKRLNKLMHNHNITAAQRVLYVSGMLLSMQIIEDESGNKLQDGLKPDDLQGIQTENYRDGKKIVNQLEEFLRVRDIPDHKQKLMLSSFSEISKDAQRDEKTKLDKEVAKFINGEASANKQIFTFIYEYIYSSIDAMAGHLDIMGEMYSEFLKYALGDGKEIGIVLTPPYVTEMMAKLLNVNQDSKVMDLATGSAGFLISAMELMKADAEKTYGKGTTKAKEKIEYIKKTQLLGVELNAEMYSLATTNMILRGDGSAKIQKGNTFNTPEEIYTNFKANKLLLNPPFSYDENGMPFIAFGLDKMERGGLGAIIIQDSAGNGKAVRTNQSILKKHTLIASIKMPVDLFQPMAGVQTSIYVFEAHKPHDFDKLVKFIDFRDDGYKRTSRSLQEIDEPEKRYKDIVKIYKGGTRAQVEAVWNLDEIFVEDFITPSGADWNFDQHKKIDTKPTFDDFRKTIADYLSWEVDQLLKQGDGLEKSIQKKLQELETKYDIQWREYEIGELFDVQTTKKKFNAQDVEFGGKYRYVARGESNNGIRGYIDEDTQYLNNGNTISFGQDTATMFYQPEPYFTGDKIKVFQPQKNVELNRQTAQFFITAMKRAFSSFSWGSSSYNVAVLNSTKIQLPTSNNKIAFDYIDEFINMLDKEHINILSAYLQAR